MSNAGRELAPGFLRVLPPVSRIFRRSGVRARYPRKSAGRIVVLGTWLVNYLRSWLRVNTTEAR